MCSNESKGTAFTPEVILNVSYEFWKERYSQSLSDGLVQKLDFCLQICQLSSNHVICFFNDYGGECFFLLLIALKRRLLNKNDIIWIQIDKCIKLCERPDEEGALSSIDGIYARVARESGDFDGFHSISTEIQIILTCFSNIKAEQKALTSNWKYSSKFLISQNECLKQRYTRWASWKKNSWSEHFPKHLFYVCFYQKVYL